METNTGVQAPGASAAPDGSAQQAPTQTPAQTQSQPQSGKTAVVDADRPTGEQGREPMTAEQRREAAARRNYGRAQQFDELSGKVRNLETQVAGYNALAKHLKYENVDDMLKKEGAIALQNGEINPDLLAALMGGSVQAMIDNHPTVQAASAFLGQQRQQQEAEAGKQFVAQEMADFRANPDFKDFGVKEVTDFHKVMTGTQFDTFRDFIDEGYSFSDAFTKVFDKELQAKRSGAVKQQVLNSITGREHLKPPEGGGDGLETIIVPDADMAEYKLFNPKMTVDQIRAHWAKTQEQMKGTG